MRWDSPSGAAYRRPLPTERWSFPYRHWRPRMTWLVAQQRGWWNVWMIASLFVCSVCFLNDEWWNEFLWGHNLLSKRLAFLNWSLVYCVLESLERGDEMSCFMEVAILIPVWKTTPCSHQFSLSRFTSTVSEIQRREAWSNLSAKPKFRLKSYRTANNIWILFIDHHNSIFYRSS